VIGCAVVPFLRLPETETEDEILEDDSNLDDNGGE
jgi:hypothetical protein